MERTASRPRPEGLRRLPGILAVAIALTVAGASLGFADPPEPLRQIEIHDAQGRVRIRLGVDDRGRAALRILDAEGRPAFAAVVPEGGGASVRLDHGASDLRTLLDGAQVRIAGSRVDGQGRVLKMAGREIRIDGATSSIELRDNRHEPLWSAP